VSDQCECAMCAPINAARAEDEALRERVKVLEAALRECADERCEYGDDCPPNAGTRHGTCQSCKARAALAGEVCQHTLDAGEQCGCAAAHRGRP
jgi:hypothetical protein